MRERQRRRVGMLLAQEVEVTGNRQRRHDRENEDQADQQVERAAEADGDLGGVGLAKVGQPRAQADADPREPHAKDGHHPDVECDHHRAHPQHQVAQEDQPLGGEPARSPPRRQTCPRGSAPGATGRRPSTQKLRPSSESNGKINRLVNVERMRAVTERLRKLTRFRHEGLWTS